MADYVSVKDPAGKLWENVLWANARDLVEHKGWTWAKMSGGANARPVVDEKTDDAEEKQVRQPVPVEEEKAPADKTKDVKKAEPAATTAPVVDGPAKTRS